MRRWIRVSASCRTLSNRGAIRATAGSGADSPEKYGFHQRGFGSHQALADYVRPGSKILDAGCASGYMMAFLRSIKECECVGLEPNPIDAVRAVARGFQVISEPLESGLTNAAAYGPFDHVIFGDVLEHTVEPGELLVKTKGLLGPSGTIVVSLPNVVSLIARLKLAAGCWRYTPTGIFDETHLRFFSVATGRELLSGAGYAIQRELFVGPLTYYGGKRLCSVNALRPGILGTQMIFEALPFDG